MADEELKLLFQSLGQQILEGEADPSATASVLFAETLKFRKKFKEETDETLSLEDVRKALEGLEKRLKGEPLPPKLTAEQKALAMILIDNVTIFKKS